jgi:hypothetical protein
MDAGRRNRQTKSSAASRLFSEQQTSGSAISGAAFSYSMGDAHNTRKPTSSPRPSGPSLLRAAERALTALKYQDPPRTTRATLLFGSTQAFSLPSNSSCYAEQVHSQTFPCVS